MRRSLYESGAHATSMFRTNAADDRKITVKTEPLQNRVDGCMITGLARR